MRPACLATLAALAAARAAVEAACPCASFDGSRTRSHARHLACARRALAAAVAAGRLRGRTARVACAATHCGNTACAQSGSCTTP